MSMMQRKLEIAILVVFFVVLTSGLVSAGENLLRNPGFEAPINQSSDWRLQRWGGTEDVNDIFSIDEDDKYEGAKSLSITNQKADTYSLAFQIIDVEPNTWYLLSGYAKADRDLSGDSSLPAKFFVINNVQGDPILGLKPIVSTQWQEISFVFNSQDAIQILAICYLNQKIATIWCDKMSLSKVAGPTISIDKTEVFCDGVDKCQLSVDWPEFGNLVESTKIRLVGRETDQITPADQTLGGGQSSAVFSVNSAEPGDVTLKFEAYSDEVAFGEENYGEVHWFWWEPPLTTPIALSFLATGDEDNLLQNPGFEDVTNSAWSLQQWAGSESGAFVFDAEVKYEGTKSLKITHQNTDTYSLARQGVDVEANSWYLLTGYAKSSVDLSADAWPPAKIAIDTTSGGRLAVKPIVNTEWQEISIVFNTGTNTRIVVVSALYQRAMTIWCDKMSLIKIAGPTVSVDKTEVLSDGADKCQVSIDWPEFGNLAASTNVRLVGRTNDQITPAEHTLGGGQSTATFSVASLEPGDVTLKFEAYSDEVADSGTTWFWWEPPLTTPIALSFLAAGDEDNLLQNSGFEDVTNSAWSLQQWAGSEPEAFVFDAEVKYEGTKSLKITHQNTDTYSLARQGVDVEANSWYLLTGYAKSSIDLSADAWPPAKIAIDTTSGSRLAAKPIISTEWQEISIVFNSEANTRIVVVSTLYQRAMTIWCDKMSLTKIAGPTVSIDKTEVLSDGVDKCQVSIDWPEFGNLVASTNVRLVGRANDQITPAEHTLGGDQSTATFSVASSEPGDVTLKFEAYSDEVADSGTTWFWWEPPLTTPLALNFLPSSGGTIGENLFKNSGFEDPINQSSDWRLQQWAGSEPDAFVVDGDNKYEGAKSLKITHQKSDTFSLAFQLIAVEPNTWYLLSGYAKADRDLSGDFYLPAKFFVMNNHTDKTIAFKPIVSTQWQEISIVFNSGDATSILAICYLNQKVATIWCDKMSLSKVAGPAITIDKTEAFCDGTDKCQISVAWSEFGDLVMPTKIRLVGRETDQITPTEHTLGGGQSSATFSVKSSKLGDVTLKFEVYSDEVGYGEINWFWWEPPLTTPIALKFISDGADPTKSLVESDFASRPAGGDKYPVKVSVQTKRVDGEIVSGQLVSLNKKSGPEVLIVPASALTGSDGWAHFTVTSTKAGLLVLEAKVTKSGSPQTILDQTVEIEFTNVLDLKESEVGFPAELMIADGISSYNVEVILKDEEQEPIEGRKVSLTSLPGSFFELTPASGVTDENGKAIFTIKTREASLIPLRGTLVVMVDPDEVDGNPYTMKKLIAFAGQVVARLEPANGAEDVRGQAAFRIEFHNPVQLQSGSTKIRVAPTSGNVGNSIEETYSPNLTSWKLQGNQLVWQHASLVADVWYTANIENLQGGSGEIIEPINWEFKIMVDNVPPAVATIDGHLDVEPLPWEAQVSLNPLVKVNFTEELLTDGQGIPKNLLVEVRDDQGKVLPISAISNFSYDFFLNQLSFILSNLTANTTYTISLSAALDLVNLVMEPAIWSFRTIADAESPLELIKWESQNNIFDEPTVRTDLKFYFNKDLSTTPLPEVIVTEKGGGTSFSGSTTFIDYLGTKGLQFNFTKPLKYDTSYEVTFSNVADLSGNPFSGTVTFTTEVVGSDEKEVTGSDETFTFTMINFQGNVVQISLHIPAGSLPSGTKVKVRNIKASELELFAGGIYNQQLSLISAIYEFVAFQGDEVFGGRFVPPITITIPYQDNGAGQVLDLFDNLIPEESLRIFGWDPRNQEWRPIGGIVDPLANVVSITVDHFSVFGLLGTSDHAKKFLSGVALSTNPLVPGSDNRGETIIEFQLAYDSKVTLVIYDSRGKVVTKLLEEVVYPAGPPNGYAWDGTVNGRRLRPGIYIYRLFASSVDQNHRDDGWVSGTIGIIW